MTTLANAQTLDLSTVIRPGDGVIWGQATAEPLTLTEAFVAQRARLGGVSAFLGVNFGGVTRPEHADHIAFSAYCGLGANRALSDAGVLDIYPLPYSQLGAAIRAGTLKSDVVMVQLSPPNARGEYSLGLSTEYLIPALARARVVIAEVNDQIPWTHTETVLRDADIDLMVHSSRPACPLPYGAPGETERRIAANAAPFVPDGGVLEFGVGALPIAVLEALGGHRDLGVHSGIVCETVMDLVEKGVITNARKNIDPGVSVGGVLFGTSRFHRWAHENPALQLRSSDYTHNGRVLGSIDRFIAINSAVEVDLTGQINAEVVLDAKGRASYVGAIGGALDFIRGANQSEGGCSIIALPASIGTKVSRIVARLSGPVATPRSEAGVFVTEWGAADLRGLPVSRRVPRMIAIANPAFRESLEREAHAQGLLR
jgi:acyl-CoA hydrolase